MAEVAKELERMAAGTDEVRVSGEGGEVRVVRVRVILYCYYGSYSTGRFELFERRFCSALRDRHRIGIKLYRRAWLSCIRSGPSARSQYCGAPETPVCPRSTPTRVPRRRARQRQCTCPHGRAGHPKASHLGRVPRVPGCTGVPVGAGGPGRTAPGPRNKAIKFCHEGRAGRAPVLRPGCPAPSPAEYWMHTQAR